MSFKLRVAKEAFMLSVIMLNVVMLNVVVPQKYVASIIEMKMCRVETCSQKGFFMKTALSIMTRNIENHYAVCHIVIVMLNVFMLSVEVPLVWK
jgi:hypothetical protein